MKKVIAFIIVFVMSAAGVQAAEYDNNDRLVTVLDTIFEETQEPSVSSIGGEWAVLALSRGNAKLNSSFYGGYYKKAAQYISDDAAKRYTDYSRLLIAISAIGEDSMGVEKRLDEFENVTAQGINGAIFALIAMDCADYESEQREKYIEYILSNQNSDGGFGFTADYSDVDLTAMALQALAPYRERDRVEQAVFDGADFINGSEITSSESASQCVIALCTLGMIPDRYVTELMQYYTDGGFEHVLGGGRNAMATEQGALALVSLMRYENSMPPLYDMSDAERLTDGNAGDCTFYDVTDEYAEDISRLAKCGIIKGKNEHSFEPNGTLTRAQTAAIFVRALATLSEINISGENYYSDVGENDWFRVYVNTASYYGIVNGVGNGAFNPNGCVRREELAVMLKRFADAVGRSGAEYDFDALTQADKAEVAEWARTAEAYCIGEGIFKSSDRIEPLKKVTRLEAAEAIAKILWND